jgi:hypothetical protein
LTEAETQIIFVKTLSPVIDGSHLPLTQLAQACLNALAQYSPDVQAKISLEKMQDFIKLNSERKVYGIPAECPDMINDVSEEALYCWEVVNVSLMEGIVAKDVNLIRTSRSLLSDKIRILAKIVSKLEKAAENYG